MLTQLFERAADAVIDGDLTRLAELLAADPALVTARSRRVTDRNPPVHRATLLHYIAANGVEDIRQRSPKNAVEVAPLLLNAGADPNTLADMYGGQCTTMSLLHAHAGPLHHAALGGHTDVVRLLVECGARLDLEDTIHHATPAGWADHGGHPAIAAYLRARLS